jgi:iron complex transport system substrate-binding protein
MKNNSLIRLATKAALTVGLLAGLSSTSALAEKITVTDIAGRSVSVEKNPSKIVLGEGRMIYSIALLDREDPFKRVVGWKDDLIRFDPDHYRKYKAKFPDIDKIKNFGSPYSSEFSLEAVVASGAEVMILNLGKLLQAQESGLLEKLEKAGIAVLFVDFRQRPTQNTVPSLQLLGRVLDRRDQADEFIDFYIQNMQTVLNRVEKIKEADRPVVFVERAAGYNPDKCCSTFGDANLGRLVDLAGGANWGSKKFSGHGGKVNPEAIFVDNPDVIIGTGANWAEANPATTAVLFGYEADDKMVQERLGNLAARKGWGELKAVKNGNFRSIYHQFYNSPYHFVALQTFAKWFYPDQFKDVEPEKTFTELHDRFLPIDYSGVFWGTLEK